MDKYEQANQAIVDDMRKQKELEQAFRLPAKEQPKTEPIKHPTIEHGEALARHLEAVMAEYSKRVATAAELIRRTVKQLAEDQIEVEKHLDLITKGCENISKIGNQRQ
jgi:hypothetical protein